MPTATETKQMNVLRNLVVEAFVLKSEMDRFEEHYEAKRKELQEKMEAAGLKSVEVEGDARLIEYGVERVFADIQQKNTTTVDAKKYSELVSEDEFWQSVNVKVTEAKKFLPARQYNDCMTVIPSTPFVQFKAK